jgi:RNA polymerase sigma-70 factor (ECF subfamily)
MSRNPNSSVDRPPSALVAGMAVGDDRALGALYDAYGHVAYGLAYTITGDQARSESVVSEAFAEAWRTASLFDSSQTSVLAWLTTIVRRIALRRGETHVRLGVNESNGAVVAAVAGTPAPMHEALRALTASQRRVIELSYYRGLTVGEIAQQLGEPEPGARELLRSAMHELRAALAGGGVFEDHVVTRA